MNTAQSINAEQLITLKEASEQLHVSIEMLLSWNHHNILKPTITPQGEVGYTQNQLDQFLTIRQLLQAPEMAVSPVSPKLDPVQKPALTVKQAMPIVTANASIRPVKSSRMKDSFSGLFTSFGIIVIVMTVALLSPQAILKLLPGQHDPTAQTLSENKTKVLGTQTSRLALPAQILAALPIQLKNEGSQEKDLQNIGEHVMREKMTIPALYAVNRESNTTLQHNQIPVLLAKRNATDGATHKADSNIDTLIANTYTSTSVFQDQCASCKTDDNAAIDASGNIKGKTDALTTILGGIQDIVNGDAIKQSATDSTNQLMLVFLGGLVIFFAFQQQFAFPTKKAHHPYVTAYKQAEEVAPQKLLEVDQKTDGTVVLFCQGKEYKISKPELSSESDQFIEMLMSLAQPGMKEIEYDTFRSSEKINLTTPLSRLVTRLGFVGMKRDLFFPRTSKNEVLFRKYLTSEDLQGMNLTIDQILYDLTKTS